MATQPHTIIITTESPQIANILTTKLERDGFHVLWKSRGRDCLNSIESDAPSLVILDSILPDLSGTELIKSIRAAAGPETLPVFILLDVLQEHSQEDFIRCGANLVFKKPFRPTDISKNIRKTLGIGLRPIPVESKKDSGDNPIPIPSH